MSKRAQMDMRFSKMLRIIKIYGAHAFKIAPEESSLQFSLLLFIKIKINFWTHIIYQPLMIFAKSLNLCKDTSKKH